MRKSSQSVSEITYNSNNQCPFNCDNNEVLFQTSMLVNELRKAGYGIRKNCGDPSEYKSFFTSVSIKGNAELYGL